VFRDFVLKIPKIAQVRSVAAVSSKRAISAFPTEAGDPKIDNYSFKIFAKRAANRKSAQFQKMSCGLTVSSSLNINPSWHTYPKPPLSTPGSVSLTLRTSLPSTDPAISIPYTSNMTS
jgi:hypothetical protein